MSDQEKKAEKEITVEDRWKDVFQVRDLLVKSFRSLAEAKKSLAISLFQLQEMTSNGVHQGQLVKTVQDSGNLGRMLNNMQSSVEAMGLVLENLRDTQRPSTEADQPQADKEEAPE